MKRIRQGWNALRRNKRSGVSLIVALCAVAVLIGLSLSIVYSSSMLLSRANRKIGRERCYQLAQSFAQVLDSELMAYNTDNDDFQADDAKHPQSGDGSTTFYEYANKVLETYQEYDPDDDKTTYYYTVGSKDDDYGKITVMLRKMPMDNSDGTKPEEVNSWFYYEEKDSQIPTLENAVFLHYQLSVSVKVEKGTDSFTYTTQYYRRDSYEPIYTWNGELESNIRVYNVNGKFCRSKNGEEELTPGTIGEGEDTHSETVKISYRYDTSVDPTTKRQNHITYKKYEPVHPPATQTTGGAADE